MIDKELFDKKSIVAVDDSNIVLQTLEGMLGNSYNFQGFSKAGRALNYLVQFPPALIILDIDMPDVNGYELMEMIRDHKELKNIPIIFLTSNKEKNSVIKAVTSGVEAYVVKPVNREILTNKIETLLNRKV